MDNDEKKVLIEIKFLKKMFTELKEIQALSGERLIQQKTETLIKYLENLLNEKEDLPFEDVIYKKMKEVKFKDPELNSKLYILYRKLSDGKISEEDARILYDVYIKTQIYDKMIY
nr:hypothetical protein [Clostridium niameyense]